MSRWKQAREICQSLSSSWHSRMKNEKAKTGVPHSSNNDSRSWEWLSEQAERRRRRSAFPFSVSLSQFYKTPVKDFTACLWRATQIKAFSARKQTRRRIWWCKSVEKERERGKKDHRANNSTKLWAHGGHWGGDWCPDERLLTGSFNSSPPHRCEPSRTTVASRRATPSRAPTPPAGGCSCACRRRRCRSWRLPGWISRRLCPAWTAPGTCRTGESTWSIAREEETHLICSALLVRDVDVELLPVCGRGPGAVEFGDDLDQMIAAE